MRNLDILKSENLKSRFARLTMRGLMGFFPEGLAWSFVDTPFDLSAYQKNMQFMKPTSDWTKAENELFAAYVSAQNHCRF